MLIKKIEVTVEHSTKIFYETPTFVIANASVYCSNGKNFDLSIEIIECNASSFNGYEFNDIEEIPEFIADKFNINENLVIIIEPTLESVNIYLDDNLPDDMDGLFRIGKVSEHFSDGSEHDHQELVDNTEFYEQDAIRHYVSYHLGVGEDYISILG